jgi:hypothetical protein
MKKINQIMALSFAAIGLVACGGGGSEGTQAVDPVVTSWLQTTVVPISQVGMTDIFEPNNQKYLDFKPYGQSQFFYLYVTNNQPLPVFGMLKPGRYSVGVGWANIESQPLDSMNCQQYESMSNPLPPGGTCRALVNNFANYEAGYPESMVANFEFGGSAIIDKRCINNVCGGPGIRNTFPVQLGHWIPASESQEWLGAISANQGFFTGSPSGNYVYTNTDAGAGSADGGNAGRYSVTWRSDGTPWVNLTPVQKWIGPNGSTFFMGVQQDGTPDCLNCNIWGQNSDLSLTQSIMNYSTAQWVGIPNWNQIASSFNVASNSYLVNGLDGNFYVTGGTPSVSYKIIGNTAIAINTNGNDFQAIAANGTLVGSKGCLTTNDGINYTLTPYVGLNPGDSVMGGYINQKVYVSGMKLDLATCTINKYVTQQFMYTTLNGQRMGYKVFTSKGVFGMDRYNFTYYPYPPVGN